MGDDDGVNGTNGHAVEPTTPSSIELLGIIASYRTALVALLDLMKRERTEYRSWADQMLVRQCEQLVAAEPSSKKK